MPSTKIATFGRLWDGCWVVPSNIVADHAIYRRRRYSDLNIDARHFFGTQLPETL